LIEDTPEEQAREEAEFMREVMEARNQQKAAHEVGLPALRRLFKIAQGHSGQCRNVAAFLLGLYNGSRFPFDMTNFRAVDTEIFNDMLLVLRMDSRLIEEVHTYFDDGGQAFEQLAQDWNLYKREWEPDGQGFTRRYGEYRLDIEAGLSGASVAWTWIVSRYSDDGDREQVASGKAYSSESAKHAIGEWFDRGGESPHNDD
jgi:hypothetical protein